MTAAHIVPNVADAASSPSTSSSLDNDTEKIIHNSTTTTKGRLWVQSSVKDALAGAAAGVFAKTAVAPIERVKLLLQLQLSLDKSTPGSTLKQPNGGYAGNASQVAWKVYANQGILAFWRGNTPNILRQGGAAGLNFLFMDWYKSAIAPIMTWSLTLPSNRSPSKRKKRRALLSSFLSGGLAGGTVTTVLYPVEFLRTRLAMDIGHCVNSRLYPNGMRDVFMSTLRSDGIRGLYQGYGIALSGVVVYRALHLGGYDALKTEILFRRSNDLNSNSSSLTLGERFMAAQIVSILAGTICYPIDSVRRRLMMQAGQPLEQRLYRNSIHAFWRIQMEEGIRGFYLGIGPNLMRSFGGALLLVSYDVFKGMSS